ncbi:uncharacterized protein LOC115983660 [Quercus lobata]|uniref:Uncharacterized protein n=1 Tax=Quercus lobata TaxID=97700 RepID=A0A7N2R316_QUELO|nr:uncharacterized protein LOC115983660 [Quercus lobata]
MDSNNLSNLLSERSEQELHFFKQFLVVFGFSFSFLLALVGLKYQNSDGALFHEHGVIMVLVIIDVCTGTIALAMVTLPNSHNSSLLLVEFVCLICGAFACDLLILILVPPFGWFMLIICALGFVCILYSSYPQILESIWQAPSQTPNGSPMLTPNKAETQMAEMA